MEASDNETVRELMQETENEKKRAEDVEGMYAHRRLKFLKEFKEEEYDELARMCELANHLQRLQDEAWEQVHRLTAQMAKAEGATEELKMQDPMKWVGLMNSCRASAEEIVNAELIYV